jgi:hypothetical protein
MRSVPSAKAAERSNADSFEQLTKRRGPVSLCFVSEVHPRRTEPQLCACQPASLVDIGLRCNLVQKENLLIADRFASEAWLQPVQLAAQQVIRNRSWPPALWRAQTQCMGRRRWPALPEGTRGNRDGLDAPLLGSGGDIARATRGPSKA